MSIDILPFFGKINIGYLPNAKLVGISHLVELVDIFAKRLQDSRAAK